MSAQDNIINQIDTATQTEVAAIGNVKTAMEAGFARIEASLAGNNVDPAVISAALDAGKSAVVAAAQAVVDEANAKDAPVSTDVPAVDANTDGA